MESLKVTIRRATADDHSMLFLLAEENLHPLAVRAGHPERFDGAALLDAARARRGVRRRDRGATRSPATSPSTKTAGDVDLRCFCVNPAHEARMVANRLLDWVEGLAISRGRRAAHRGGPGRRRVVAAPVPPARLHVAGGRRSDGHDRAREAPARALRAGRRLSSRCRAARRRTSGRTPSRRPRAARARSRGSRGTAARPGSRGCPCSRRRS